MSRLQSFLRDQVRPPEEEPEGPEEERRPREDQEEEEEDSYIPLESLNQSKSKMS